MKLNDALIKEFVKAINQKPEKQTALYYGTIVRVDVDDETKVRQAYVHLDGSEKDLETPVVEGTEVMKDDRVLVTIENHKAVVMSNITSPASARTASSYMDLFPEGLVIGEIDNDPTDIDFNVLIKPDGMYIRYGVDSDDPNDPEPVILARYTVNGVFLGQNDEIIIRASSLKETIERFDTTSFTLSKDVSRIISIVGETCIDTVVEDGVSTQVIVNDVTIPSSDYVITGNTITVNSPLTGTNIEPRSIVVEYAFSDELTGTIAIGSKAVISEKYPLVIGNNNPNKVASNIFSVDWSGKVSAAGGCNAKIIYVEKTVSGLSVSHGNSVAFTTKITIPTGYAPCGLIAYRIKEHTNTCCFYSVDIDMDGTIKYGIQNHGSTSASDWTDIGAYFQVACIRTV